MRRSNIYLSALLGLLALAAVACDPEEDPGGDDEPRLVCPAEAEDAECAGDTVCMDTGCEWAFDRYYRVQLSTYQSRKELPRCHEKGDCRPPLVRVYYSDNYSDKSAAIIDSVGPSAAEIKVVEGSSLKIDSGTSICDFALTAERLRGGHVSCGGRGVTAFLSLAALDRR